MRVVFGFLALLLFSANAFSQAKISIALFNLTPKSIEAIGLDGDLLFTMRQEMERSNVFQLLSRREMEDGLYRIDGAQVADTTLVAKYGGGLGVNFVLTGNVDLVRSTIVVDFILVDVLRGVEASAWRESFRTQGELVSRAPEIAQSLERRVLEASQAQQNMSVETILLTFDAENTDTGVDIRWETVDLGPVFFYNLFRSESQTGPFEFVTSVTDPFYTDAGVNKSGTYYYRLDVVLESGDEVKGSKLAEVAVSAMQSSRDISPPSILKSKAFVSGVEIGFVPAIANKEKPIGYQVYFREKNQRWQKAAYVNEVGKIDYTVRVNQNLKPDTEYEFGVTTVVAGDKESPVSSPVTIKTAPSLSVSVDDAIETRKVQLSWQPVINEVGVRIYRREAGVQEWSRIAQLEPQHYGQYIDKNGLEDGKTYEYTVTLYDQASESPQSNVVTKATKKLPAPQNLAVSTGVKSLTVTWDKVDDPDVVGYTVYRVEGDITQSTLLDELTTVAGANTTQLVDGKASLAPLKDGTKYNYLVVAKNEFGGVGEVSQTRSAVTKPRPNQAGVVALSVRDDAIVIDWPASSEPDIATYHLYRKWNNDTWQLVSSLPSNSLQYVDVNLKPYAQTHYRIVAEDKDGLQSTPSESESIVSPQTLVLSVAEDNMLRKISLAWPEYRNVDGYKIYYRVAGTTNWKLVKTFKKASTTYFMHDDKRELLDGTSYEYAMTAIDGNNETPMSNVVTAKTMPAPDAPTAFNVESDQVKQVLLTWEPVNNAAVIGYKIYRYSGNKRELIETIKGQSVNRYLDEGDFFEKLKDGVTYQYQISAVNQYDAEGSLSDIVEAQTKPVPEPVGGLQLADTAPSITLDWQPSPEDDIDYYQIYRGTSCPATRKVAKSGSTRFIDSDVTSGKTYCYKVSAVDLDELEGRLSSGVEITTSLLNQEPQL